jgi:acylphosphatase
MAKVERPSEQRTGSDAQARLSAIVRGRVQGVSFRYYTQRRAAELGLTGTARNLWDGSVEVIAEGPRRDVEDLLAFLRVGPRAAFVTGVDVEWSAPLGDLERFEVRA